jgi:hypothetical protein
MAKWDRLQGEPIQWFDRLERYRLLGTTRTIETVWRAERESREQSRTVAEKQPSRPGSLWYQAAERWKWTERSEAWDAYQIALRRRQFAAEAARDKTDRIALLKSLRGKYAQTLNLWTPDAEKAANTSLDDLARALKIIVNELRNEYDDQPAQRLAVAESEVDGRIRELAGLLFLNGQDRHGGLDGESSQIDLPPDFDDFSEDGD